MNSLRDGRAKSGLAQSLPKCRYRNKDGIIGHATNTLLEDEKNVLVYHQAESFKALDTFLVDPELKESMELAGATSEPEVFFATGGWAKLYATPERSPEDKPKTGSPSAHA